MDYQKLDEENPKQQLEADYERGRLETTSGMRTALQILNEIIDLRGYRLSGCTVRVNRNYSSPDFDEIVDSTGRTIARLYYALVRDVSNDPDGSVRNEIKSLLETQLKAHYRI